MMVSWRSQRDRTGRMARGAQDSVLIPDVRGRLLGVWELAEHRRCCRGSWDSLGRYQVGQCHVLSHRHTCVRIKLEARPVTW